MSQQSTAEPRRPGPPVAADEQTRPVSVPPEPPTRMVGNFVVTVPPPAEVPAPAEAPSPAGASRSSEAPSPVEVPASTQASSATEVPAVLGPPTTLMPALPRVAGARPTSRQPVSPVAPAPADATPAAPAPADATPAAPAPAEATPADATSAPSAQPAPLTADQPTVQLPGGTGRAEDAATVTWLAGPGPGPMQYPRVVPRRHPVRALLLVLLLLLAVAAVVWAVLLA